MLLLLVMCGSHMTVRPLLLLLLLLAVVRGC
jgi:hypothetical protein